MENSEVAQPVAKATTAWIGAGLSADEIASILAALYTILLIGEWCWKKAVHFGWIKPRKSNAEKNPK